MEENVIGSERAGCFKRIFSFLLDSVIITFISAFLTKIFLFTNANLEKIDSFVEDFKVLFGVNINFFNANEHQIRFIANSPVINIFVTSIIINIVIAILYNFLCYVFLNSSTLSQKLLSLKTVNINNDKKPSTIKFLLKSIFVQFPNKLLYLMVVGMILHLVNFDRYVPRDTFYKYILSLLSSISNIYVLAIVSFLFFLLWYDIYFITNKLILSDILSGTKVIELREYDKIADNKDMTYVFDKILEFIYNLYKKIKNIFINIFNKLK